MASTYSTNLAIELIGTGDQPGQWGVTTNTNLGTLIEQAISGYVTQAVATGTDTTITIPNGATGVARNMYIELTGTGGASTNLIVPANKKLYFIFNNTASGQVTVKVSGQTGVSVPNGAKMILVSNGTDIVDATNYIGNISAASANITTLTGTTLIYGSASITGATVTSAFIPTLRANSATITSATITGLASPSANLTRAVIGSASVTGMAVTSAVVTTLTGTTLIYGSASISNATVTSAFIPTLTGTNANITSATVTNLAVTSAVISNLTLPSTTVTNLTATSATITTLTGTTLIYGSASITGATVTSAFIPTLTATSVNGVASAGITRLVATSASITTVSGTTLIYGSASLTGATVTSAFIPTLTGTNATITTLSGTTLVYGSASITGATVTSAFIPTLTGTNATVTSATITTLSGTTLIYGSASITGATITSAFIPTLTANSANITSATITGFNSASAFATRLVATSSTITTIASTSATITSITTTNLRGVSSAGVTRLTATSASITGLSVTSAAIGKFTAGSSAVSNLFASGAIAVSGNITVNTSLTDTLGFGGSTVSVAGPVYARQSTDTARYVAIGTLSSNGYLAANTVSNLYLYVGSSTVATLTSTGNLGLGVTPSAWSGTAKALQVANVGVEGRTDNASYATLSANGYTDSGTWKYISSDFASRYTQFQGQHLWLTAPSGTAGNTITFTQAMTLDASGQLGVGLTNPPVRFTVDHASHGVGIAYMGASALPSIAGVFTDSSSGQTGYGSLLIKARTDFAPFYSISFYTASTANTPVERARITAGGNFLLTSGGRIELNVSSLSSKGAIGAFNTDSTNGGLTFLTEASGTLTERARITSTGRFCVNATATKFTSRGIFASVATAEGNALEVETETTGNYPLVAVNKATTGDNVFIYFGTEAAGTARGNITYNRAGGLVAYNTTSDYRAKDIIGPLQNVGETIDGLKVYEGLMKGATESRPMLIAHEAQEYAPYAVSGVKDEVNEDGTPKYQQIDVSSLVPLLLAEIQSLRARVAALEAK